MTVPHDPRLNHLLRALPGMEYARLLPHLELVPMPLGCVLYESGSRLRYVYFPTNSIVSPRMKSFAGSCSSRSRSTSTCTVWSRISRSKAADRCLM